MPRPPLLSLLLRAVVWTPVGLIIMILWITSNACTILLPLIGLIHLYNGDYLPGPGFLLASLPSYFLARYLNRRFWEIPGSFL